MINPYESPVSVEPHSATKFAKTSAAPSPTRFESIIRAVIFALNFSVVTVYVAVIIATVANFEMTMGALSVLMFAGPILTYGVFECIAFFRGSRSVECFLGYANLVCAAIVGFGVIVRRAKVFVFRRCKSSPARVASAGSN